MNDKQVDMLMETAQRVFVDELKKKIDEMERLFATCKDKCSESDIQRIIRFFHSVNGTASTLGLDYLSSVGKEWEVRLRELTEKGHNFDKDNLRDAYMAINAIKKKIDNLGEIHHLHVIPYM